MNPEFKVLTNANESNLRVPIIQDRFRKLTLQSPRQQQQQIPPKLPQFSALPQSRLATEQIVNPPASPYKSQTQTITNKLMLSTSSGNLSTERTNFINVETEPFSNPLQVENTESDAKEGKMKENENVSPKNQSLNSDNQELASQMEELESSRVSVDLFSQFSSSSKISLPPNRILSNKENIDNLSQRMSNIRMVDNGDLADTQPNTPSQGRQRFQQYVGDTQPNTSSQEKPPAQQSLGDTQPNSLPHCKEHIKHSVSNESLIVLSSDSEDHDNLDGDNAGGNRDSLMTEESEDDSVIELLSSDDNLGSGDYVPRDISPINTEIEELTESVARKLNNFFENIPKVDVPFTLNHLKESESVASINISETTKIDDCDENNALQSLAPQLDENLDKSGSLSCEKEAVEELSPNKKEEYQNNETLSSSKDKSPHGSRIKIGKTGEKSTVDNGQESTSDQNESSNATSPKSNNRSTDENQLSVPEAKKKADFENIETSTKKVMHVNSPVINISARVNIHIQVSGFSSSSSDSGATSENTDDYASEQSSKNDDSEIGTNSSSEYVAHCTKLKTNPFSGGIRENLSSANNKAIDEINNDTTESKAISLDLSVIESSISCDGASSRYEDKEHHDPSAHKSIGSIVTKESTNASHSSVDGAQEAIIDDANPMDEVETNASVSPLDTSVVIDEVGEQLLTEIYGDTWRTPQLMKKCMSTRKKCFTDVIRGNRSRGFSLFQRDVPSELESTRITPSCSGRDHSKVSTPNKEINGTDADRSSRIIRSRRRVATNRILDFSDDDDDDSESRDSSFESVTENDEENDSSFEIVVKPKSATRRKRNPFVYLDLTCHEVIEDEDHENPDASSEELEKLGQSFLQSIETKTDVQTPATAKKVFPPSITKTKRKLFTPNYDDQAPFDEQAAKTPEPSRDAENKKEIQLKTPIPSFLIPPQFRDRVKIDAEPITPTGVRPSKATPKFQTPRTPASTGIYGFLESLDDKLIPEEHCDPDALIFRKRFKANRNELVKRLMKIFNHYIFDNKLSDVPVTWSKTLTKTAGRCRLRKIGGIKKGPIELSEKVLTSADRLRDTLVHELCHAAAWIINSCSEGHGKVWKYWADLANKKLPVLPKIERCHNYDISYKYTYKCTICGLRSQSHSKSKKVENCRCAACHGPIELFVNKTDKDGNVYLVPPKEPSAFAKFVKENYKLHKVAGCKHADVMKILSNNFGKLTVEEKSKYKN